MSEQRYEIVPLEEGPGGHHYANGVSVFAATLDVARRIVREEYQRTGIVPDVFKGGKSIQVYTNDEVAKWGLD